MSVTKAYKPRFQHYAIMLVILFGVIYWFQSALVADSVLWFIKSQFKPQKKELVEFNGVWATPSKTGEKHIGEPMQKKYVDLEYFFDFTPEVRTEKEHGYNKGSGEWMVRAPKLGEEAIVLEPYGFLPLSFIFGMLAVFIITFILPPSLGYISQKVYREVYNTKAKIRLQTGFNNDIVEVLTMRNGDLEKLYDQNPSYVRDVFRIVWNRTIPEDERQGDNGGPTQFDKFFTEDEDVSSFRNQILLGRIKEVMSEVIVTEIEDVRAARDYMKFHVRIFPGLRLYMVHHFAHKYSNIVTGFAYGGAAFLIIAVGIRGLKFIPATRPSLIFFAILMEFTMLCLLAVTLFYTEGEERMDKMLKKMEDASKNQLDSLNRLATDMHKLAVAFEGGTSEMMKAKVEEAVSEYLQSEDNVQSAVAHAIRDKLVVSINNSFPTPENA